jgi:hypothetical protein
MAVGLRRDADPGNTKWKSGKVEKWKSGSRLGVKNLPARATRARSARLVCLPRTGVLCGPSRVAYTQLRERWAKRSTVDGRLL